MQVCHLTATSAVLKKKKKETYPVTTDLRNLVALSTTSSHTEDTVPSSKRDASGKARSASSDSCSNSLHRSASSPKEHSNISYISRNTQVLQFFVYNVLWVFFFLCQAYMFLNNMCKVLKFHILTARFLKSYLLHKK